MKHTVNNLKKQSTKFMDEFTSLKKEIFKQPIENIKSQRRTSNLGDALLFQQIYEKGEKEKKKEMEN